MGVEFNSSPRPMRGGARIGFAWEPWIISMLKTLKSNID
jgi:hypothetical protein